MNLSTSKPLILSALKSLWYLLTGVPEEPERFYFKKLEDVELAVDWGRRKIHIRGGKIVRATDYEAVFIKHLLRTGNIKNIDD